MDYEKTTYEALTPEWEERVLSIIMSYSRLLEANAKRTEEFRKDLLTEERPKIREILLEGLESFQESRQAMLAARHKFATWLGMGDQYPANPN